MAPRRVDFWPFGGMIAMAVVLFLFGASALVAPWWAVLVLMVVWLVAFVVACRWFATHPRRISALAGGLAVLWLASLLLGASLLDWSSR